MTFAARPRGLWFWHRWIGLVAAAVLVVATGSGSLLVYKKPLVRWLVAGGVELPAGYGPAQMLVELDRIGDRIAGDGPVLIKAPNAEEPYWTLTGEDGHVELLRIGELTAFGDNLKILSLFVFVRELHTEMLAGLTGEWLYLIAGVLAITLSVTGIILWWPSGRVFRWRWIWPRPLRWRSVLQYHRHCGALFLPMLILLVLTGGLMLWQKLVSPLLPPEPAMTEDVSSQIKPEVATAMPSALLALALEHVPDGWPTYIRLPANTDGEARFRFRLPGEWHPNGRTSVDIDTTSAEMRVSRRADQVAPVRRLVNQLYPLHSGYGISFFYRLVVLATGVSLFWLSLTGIVSYVRQRG